MATPPDDPASRALEVAANRRGVVRTPLLGVGIGLLLVCVVPVLFVGIFTGAVPFTRLTYGCTFTELAALPEASLLPSGGHFLTPPIGGDGRRSWPVEEHDSFALRVFGTNQRSVDVQAFYATDLPARGWQRCPAYPNEPN